MLQFFVFNNVGPRFGDTYKVALTLNYICEIGTAMELTTLRDAHNNDHFECSAGKLVGQVKEQAMTFNMPGTAYVNRECGLCKAKHGGVV